MIEFRTICTSLLALAAVSAIPSSAYAQAVRTWVSGIGDDVNPCSRTAPCRTFAGAISKTLASGEISVLDPGDFGTVTITKSITINGGGIEGTTMNSATNGFLINGAGIDVVLRNLDIDGSPDTSPGVNGIRFIQGNSLLVENSTVRNNKTGSAAGIMFEPSSNAQLFVRNVTLSNNGTLNGNAGNGGAGGGVVVKPAAGGSARVTLDHIFAAKNMFGIAFDGSTSLSGINATITDSVSAGNIQDGIVATTVPGAAPIRVLVKNSKSVNNSIGIRSIGVNSRIIVDSSAVIGNDTGLTPFRDEGVLLSFGNNNVEANTLNGSFSGSVALK